MSNSELLADDGAQLASDDMGLSSVQRCRDVTKTREKTTQPKAAPVKKGKLTLNFAQVQWL